MPQCLDPVFSILPAAQLEIWKSLGTAPNLSFVLYGGTAIALHLGHRQSIDFDFFRAEPLDKDQIRSEFQFVDGATVLQDTPDTLAILVDMPSGPVKISFFGGLAFGRINAPLQTRDGTLLVASLEDLMATKLKATLDRAEAKDYRDIAEMISAGVSLPVALSAFKQMFRGEPSQVLRAIGFFKDGDLATLGEQDRNILKSARDRITTLPDVSLTYGSLSIPLGECDDGGEIPHMTR
jgi:nucleotidyltransferase AbiEii toxin of type IV toxin-antitoxin system